MFNWNDLKYFLAVARHGSTLAAARTLKVNQSTVQRRLVDLEEQLKLRLVERSPSGYRLTPAGEAVLAAAEGVQSAVEAFERVSNEVAHAHILRLTCPEPIADRLVRSGFLDRFQGKYPDLSVEFILADRYIDLAKGEADVALRSGDTEDVLVGRKVADSLWAVYASRDYVQRRGAPASVAEIGQHAVVAFDSSLSGHRLSVWLRDVAPNANVAARSNSVLGLVSAVKSGVGIAALPTPLGDGDPDLTRVLPPVPELSRAWRLLCHPDSRRLYRVRSFFDFVGTQIEELKPVLTG
ncbi:LysR family transcriptional regulator [Acuticoccus kandeliae]|uniref:LysR family transcriptional regulator n=1 Tax=Acuticoccus kandeliae TaxID=2073160 RepID=UPI001FE51097|nr:LysR family transcriptional regulator [Acuticoccus kandeliae]